MAGGTGSDAFVFAAATDSTASTRDVIWDFTQGEDVIDVSAFASFGDLTITQNACNTVISTTDIANDFEVQLLGVHALTQADFVA